MAGSGNGIQNEERRENYIKINICGESITKYISDKRPESRIYKKGSKLNTRKTNNSILKVGKRFKQTLHRISYRDEKGAS